MRDARGCAVEPRRQHKGTQNKSLTRLEGAGEVEVEVE